VGRSSVVEYVQGEAAADWVLDAIREASPPRSRGLSAAKQIAAVALYLHAAGSLCEERALQAAGRAYAQALRPTPAALKKAVSEARAILQLGLEPGLAESLRDELPLGRLARIDAALRGVNQAQVTRARAEALAGGRGGRPIQPPRTAYGAVLKLLDLVRAGDLSARAELAAIQDLMRRAPPPARTADRRAASR
jgi:hypothetical protein